MESNAFSFGALPMEEPEPISFGTFRQKYYALEKELDADQGDLDKVTEAQKRCMDAERQVNLVEKERSQAEAALGFIERQCLEGRKGGLRKFLKGSSDVDLDKLESKKMKYQKRLNELHKEVRKMQDKKLKAESNLAQVREEFLRKVYYGKRQRVALEQAFRGEDVNTGARRLQERRDVSRRNYRKSLEKLEDHKAALAHLENSRSNLLMLHNLLRTLSSNPSVAQFIVGDSGRTNNSMQQAQVLSNKALNELNEAISSNSELARRSQLEDLLGEFKSLSSIVSDGYIVDASIRRKLGKLQQTAEQGLALLAEMLDLQRNAISDAEKKCESHKGNLESVQQSLEKERLRLVNDPSM
uniref:Uncharacterized protein n=1 Tax=Rhodosorus marinus TaxID=101924 RepID=A0A7S3EDW7_9RHOD|mmetsp:Transcript_28176/g.110714  ORF Transcript_28176/g.110714 Transcript_28176/m.110714 type:complete len:356 (+) Transcript_28176:210-1277(+)